MRIIPISPYERIVGFIEHDTTIEKTYAVEHFSYNEKTIKALDSFVLKRIPENYLKDKHGILFLF